MGRVASQNQIIILDVTTGIATANRTVLEQTKVPADQINGVIIGTTHFTNAVVERKRLMETASIRLRLPASDWLLPMVNRLLDLRDTIGDHKYLMHGDHKFEGTQIGLLPHGEAPICSDVDCDHGRCPGHQDQCARRLLDKSTNVRLSSDIWRHNL